MTISYIQSWLDKQDLVIVGYADNTKGINFYSLIGFYLDCNEDFSQLEDDFPCVANHFQICISNCGGEDLFHELLENFDGCQHVKAWVYGEEIC